MDTIKFMIPGKPEYLTMVRLAISSVATTCGFDLDAIEDIKTAVGEACKHVSCHGFDGYSDQYEVICYAEQKHLEIRVKDACDTHSLEKLSRQCRNCPQDGDLGVFVIKSLMNEVSFCKTEDDRNEIVMIKRG